MSSISRLSIIFPVYNEEATIEEILRRVIATSLPQEIEKEFIIVDDHSTDNTNEKIEAFKSAHPRLPIHHIRHEKNLGKGSAIHTGIAHITGDYIIIQDADLEYNPEDYRLLIEPVIKGDADVVYGSRFVGSNPHRILFFWHTIGNRFLTFLSNLTTNLNLTDMESGYKLFRAGLFDHIHLKEKRFGFEPEVTARISKIPKIKIFEVGVSYYGRTYDQGKKIKWRDGFRAIYCILKYGLFSGRGK